MSKKLDLMDRLVQKSGLLKMTLSYFSQFFPKPLKISLTKFSQLIKGQSLLILAKEGGY